jgi:two-component system sensor kinase FixL
MPLPSTPLDESRVRFEALLATAVDGIVVIDAGGTVRAYNPACERLFGYSPAEVVGENVKMLMPEPDRAAHDGYLTRYHQTRRRQIIGIGREVLGRRKSGETFPMYLSVGEGYVDGQSIFVGIIHDTTDRHAAEKRLHDIQQELVHVSRLSEMGQMASALAHELNQPLAAISNYVKAAQRTAQRIDHPDAARVSELIEKAAGQALRAGEIIRRLRTFTNKSDAQRVPEDLNALVEEAMGLALVGTGEANVSVRTELAPHLPPVLADRIQIQQVVLNLVRNSIEAMVGRPRRELVVATLQSAGLVHVHIADTGPGLDPTVAANLFQPFVTTKAAGMGIGLSICKSIIEAHDGRLWLEDTGPGGTTFRFSLPAVAGSGEQDG